MPAEDAVSGTVSVGDTVLGAVPAGDAVLKGVPAGDAVLGAPRPLRELVRYVVRYVGIIFSLNCLLFEGFSFSAWEEWPGTSQMQVIRLAPDDSARP
jgi:hypothetical protein